MVEMLPRKYHGAIDPGPEGRTLSFGSSEKVMLAVFQTPPLVSSLAVACYGVGLDDKWTGSCLVPRRGVFYCPIFPVLSAEWG